MGMKPSHHILWRDLSRIPANSRQTRYSRLPQKDASSIADTLSPLAARQVVHARAARRELRLFRQEARDAALAHREAHLAVLARQRLALVAQRALRRGQRAAQPRQPFGADHVLASSRA